MRLLPLDLQGRRLRWEVLGSICIIIAHPHAAHPNPYRHPHFPLRPPCPHRSIIFMLILILIVIVRVFIITPPQSLIIIIGLHWIITHHELWASSSSSRSAVGSNLCFFNSLVHLVRLVCRCPFGELAAGFWAIGNVNNWNTMWQFGLNGLFCAFLHLCIHSSVYPRLTYLLQLFMVQVTAKASVLFTTSCAFGMLILGPSVHCQEMLFELKGRK